MDAVRYLWSVWYGRLAVVLAVVGVVGLVGHLWLPGLTALALPRFNEVRAAVQLNTPL